MNLKNNLKYKQITSFLIKIITFSICLYYFFEKDYTILLKSIFILSIITAISLIFYLIITFDNRLKLRYVNADEISEETRKKIIKQEKKEQENIKKENNIKNDIKNIIIELIYMLSILEIFFIFHCIFLQDFELLKNILINYLPVFSALLIAVINIFFNIFKKI